MLGGKCIEEKRQLTLEIKNLNTRLGKAWSMHKIKVEKVKESMQKMMHLSLQAFVKKHTHAGQDSMNQTATLDMSELQQ